MKQQTGGPVVVIQRSLNGSGFSTGGRNDDETKLASGNEWGKLTDDDLLAIEGRRDQLVGKIQTRYGISEAEAEAQVSTWEVRRAKDM